MRKMITTLCAVAMLASAVMANEFRFEVQSRENFAGSNDLVNNVNSLNGREVCEPGFSVTFTEKDGKVFVVHTYAADANIPAGSKPKINSNKAKSIQELRLYVPTGVLSAYTDVKGAQIGTNPNDKKDVKKFDSILIASNGPLSDVGTTLNIAWADFEAAMNALIASDAEFFMLGHYSLGYGAGGAKSIQVGRLNLVYGGEELAHFASFSLDKDIFGYWGNPFEGNSKFDFYVVCDDCECVFGPFKTNEYGQVKGYVCDQQGAVMNEKSQFCADHSDIESCHYIIYEDLLQSSPWCAISNSIGFTVNRDGTVCFDNPSVCDENGVAHFENGAKDTFNTFYMYVHLDTNGFPDGKGGSKTATVGDGSDWSIGGSNWFTYFQVDALSLTNPKCFKVVEGRDFDHVGWLVVSLDTNLDLNLSFYAFARDTAGEIVYDNDGQPCIGDRIANPGCNRVIISTSALNNLGNGNPNSNVTYTGVNPIKIPKATWQNFTSAL